MQLTVHVGSTLRQVTDTFNQRNDRVLFKTQFDTLIGGASTNGSNATPGGGGGGAAGNMSTSTNGDDSNKKWW